jgi:hypothetical protein
MAAAHLEIQGAAFPCMAALSNAPLMSCLPLVSGATLQAHL